MGDRIEASGLALGHGDEVRRRLERCVAGLKTMIDSGWFVGEDHTVGMEVELDLVDPLGRPRLVNDAVLARLKRTDMQHELGQFNVELNVARANRSFESRIGYCRVGRRPSTWWPTLRSISAWCEHSSTATLPRGGRSRSRSPSGICIAPRATGWRHSCTGRAQSTRSTGSFVTCSSQPLLPVWTPGASTKRTAIDTWVSSKIECEPAVPALIGRPRRYATSRGAGWGASRRYTR